jgi:hypothetical protein
MDKEPKAKVKTGEGLSELTLKEKEKVCEICRTLWHGCEGNKKTSDIVISCAMWKHWGKIIKAHEKQAKQSIIAEAIKELPKEKVLQNPPDIDDLGDMRFNMCLSEVKQILERISLSADIKRKENL